MPRIDRKSTERVKFKTVPKKIITLPDTIHFGNSMSGALCGANYEGARVAIQGFTCGACLDRWEDVMFDKLYGTCLQEDDTTP